MQEYGRSSVRKAQRGGFAVSAILVLLGFFVPATRALAGFAADEVYLPAVGRIPGLGGAQFYTTVWASNLTGVPVSFTFQFLKTGQANTSPLAFVDSLAPGQTQIYENVVETKLGLTSALGAARIVASGPILVSERIYNQAPGADIGDTEGLFFAGVPGSFSIGPGESATIQGINEGGSQNFHYNFALIETAGLGATANVQMFDATGVMLGQKAYPLAAFEQIQVSVKDIVPSIATTNARITATVTGGTGTVLLAGAQLANESHDSSGFEMSFKGSLLGSGGGVTSLNTLTGAVTLAAGSGISVTPSGNTLIIANTAGGGGGGLSFVTHDANLTGDGTTGSPLGVAAPLVLSNGVAGATLASGPVGVFGQTTDTSTAGVGVWGRGRVFGTYGEVVDGSSNPQSWGELGRLFNSHYYGALGFTFDTTGGAAAVYGEQGPGGSGASPAFPSGVWGDSAVGVGVFGSSANTTAHGYDYGVFGEGVLGVEGSGTVVGDNGSGTFSYGVEGDSYQQGALRIGVFGYASGGTTNYAGYFFGDVHVDGTLSKLGGSFKIDDPLDPANRYLSHSFVESPDMKNVYDGVETLGPSGTATVALPAWFQALNRDFRYQLTAIGTAQPGLFISREVENNSFTIAGGVPGARVSWQVTGIRHDAWANAHRIPVEQDKLGSEKGRYLAPLEHGQPAEKAIVRPQGTRKPF